MVPMRIMIAGDDAAFSRLAVDAVSALVRDKPDAVIGLASGSTPVGLYGELARSVAAGQIDLAGATAFAIDELHGVPRYHPATNASYFRRALRDVAVAALYVMDGEAADAEAECARFAALLAAAGGFDLVILGIGRNGHLAFNEPGSAFDSPVRRIALEPSTREPYVAHFGSLEATPTYGLTLGMPEILRARRVLLLANGEDKASIVARALEGPVDEGVPASALQRHADVIVVLDRAAAAGLTRISSAD